MRKWELRLDDFQITKYRYRELLGFCMQYPEWVKELKNGIKKTSDCISPIKITGMPSSRKIEDATGTLAVRRAELEEKCKMIEQSAIEADPEIYQYLIKNATEPRFGYRYLRSSGMPCGENKFYKARRKFFNILNNKKI